MTVIRKSAPWLSTDTFIFSFSSFFHLRFHGQMKWFSICKSRKVFWCVFLGGGGGGGEELDMLIIEAFMNNTCMCVCMYLSIVLCVHVHVRCSFPCPQQYKLGPNDDIKAKKVCNQFTCNNCLYWLHQEWIMEYPSNQ